jgi:subtilisin family serine protease
MTIRKAAVVTVAAALAAMLALPHAALAQKHGGGQMRGGHHHHHGGGGGGNAALIGLGIGIVTGIIASQPPAQGHPQKVKRPTQKQKKTSRTARAPRRNDSGIPLPPRRGGSGVPPAGETRFVPDEVVVELPNTMSATTVNSLQRRHRLTRLDAQPIALLGSTFYRFRIPDRSAVPAVIRALEADRRVASAQPNYLYSLQQAEAAADTQAPAKPASYGDPAQYAVAKMHLRQAHAIAKGGDIRVAVIDSGVDAEHPELAGRVADSFDTLKPPFTPHAHGTAIAALIAGHGRVMGSAPEARILAVRAFDPSGSGAEATTFNIIRGLDWSVTQRARIVNMSFAGPADPGIHRALAAAHKKGVVLIAAAGNAGPKSPPLYPAADPNVIAVTATDASDALFKGSNRGRHVAVAAPGVDVLIAVPDGGYQISTGTSYSAAEVSGVAALMLQRKGDLTPDKLRALLLATARDLGKTGRDDEFGAGMTDAYRAVSEVPGAQVSDAVPK